MSDTFAVYDGKMRNACISLYLDVFTDAPFNYDWLKREKIERYFKDLEQTPKFLGFVCVREQKIVGICLGVINDYFHTNKYYIKELAVRNGFRNEGIGTEMIERVGKYLAGLKISVIDLMTSNNEALLAYYKKNGFKVSETGVYMFKPL